MTSNSTSWWTCSRLVSWKTLGFLASWLCGAAALGWVALHVGPRTGTAIVHVTESDVLVNISGRMFPVSEGTELPLICPLPIGEHQIVMSRGQTILHVDRFLIEGGEDHVLTAWSSSPGNAPRDVHRLSIDPRSTALNPNQGAKFSWTTAPTPDFLLRFSTDGLAVNLWCGIERAFSTVVCATGPWSAFAIRIPSVWSLPWPVPTRGHAVHCGGRGGATEPVGRPAR